MAEYSSSFIYFLVYDDGTGEFGPVAGFYVIAGFDDLGLSVGGDEETFSIGDIITYEDSLGPIDLEYFGFSMVDGSVGKSAAVANTITI